MPRAAGETQLQRRHRPHPLARIAEAIRRQFSEYPGVYPRRTISPEFVGDFDIGKFATLQANVPPETIFIPIDPGLPTNPDPNKVPLQPVPSRDYPGRR